MDIYIVKKVAEGVAGVGIVAYTESGLQVFSGEVHIRSHLDQVDLIILRILFNTILEKVDTEEVTINSHFIRKEMILHFKDHLPDVHRLKWKCEISPIQSMPVAYEYADDALPAISSFWQFARRVEDQLPEASDERIAAYVSSYGPTDVARRFPNFKVETHGDKIYFLGHDGEDKEQISFPATGMPVLFIGIYHPGFREVCRENFKPKCTIFSK